MDLQKVTDVAAEIVRALAPIVSVAAPELGAGMAIVSKIVAGVQDAEPVALSLFNRLQTGQTVTPEQLTQFASDYEDAYQKLNADIAAKLAAS